MWLTLSAQAGDVAAGSNRQRMQLVMTAQAIAEAQELARQWRAAHPAALAPAQHGRASD
jgi:hypothetical protein